MFKTSRIVPSVSLSLVAVAIFAFGLAGCAADSTHADDSSDDHQTQDLHHVSDPVVAPVMVDENSNGKTVEVGSGQAIMLDLPSNGTTGYEWTVSSDPTPLGQPLVSYQPESSKPGAGGSTSFTWTDTKSVPPGNYTIALGYKRSWEPNAIQTFSFVVVIAE